MMKLHQSIIKAGAVMLLVLFGLAGFGRACVNDSRTGRMLWQKKLLQPSLSDAILSPKAEEPDVKSLTEAIQKLQASPKTNDPAWWNDLAGAYIRLGKPAEAAKILEPLSKRFADNYGVHANLGTAYHLLGRYVDAEREIRRDLEINPDAHFGVEKYHLALLQYLSRDERYRTRHLYVEEFTKPFLRGWHGRIYPSRFSDSDKLARAFNQNGESDWKDLETEAERISHQSVQLTSDDTYKLEELAAHDAEPGYMAKWDLGHDSKLQDGVIYMAILNPKEPACRVMLGILALQHKDFHLAKAAFEQAVRLGSPQAPLLRTQIAWLNQYPSWPFPDIGPVEIALGLIALVIGYYIFCKRREFKRNSLKKAAA